MVVRKKYEDEEKDEEGTKKMSAVRERCRGTRSHKGKKSNVKVKRHSVTLSLVASPSLARSLALPFAAFSFPLVKRRFPSFPARRQGGGSITESD